VDGGTEPVAAIAMGGIIHQVFAPIVRVDGSLTVPASGPIMRHLRLDMDEVFKGARANVDVSHAVPAPSAGVGPNRPPGGEEIFAGERLRQAAPQLPVFVLDP